MAFYELYRRIYYVKDMERYDMNRYFNWLFRAICLVDIKYLEFEVENPDDENKHMLHKERVFAYELYRQWANILEVECKESLVLNAELDKIISEDIEIEDGEIITPKEKTNQKDGKKEVRRYPDLVLHNGQGNDKDQIIICEIKRTHYNKGLTQKVISASSILADLYKLTCYMDKNEMGEKYFGYGVFILLNGNFEQIKSIKKANINLSSNIYKFNQFKKDKGHFFERIVCIIYDGKTLEYKALKSLL